MALVRAEQVARLKEVLILRQRSTVVVLKVVR